MEILTPVLVNFRRFGRASVHATDRLEEPS